MQRQSQVCRRYSLQKSICEKVRCSTKYRETHRKESIIDWAGRNGAPRYRAVASVVDRNGTRTGLLLVGALPFACVQIDSKRVTGNGSRQTKIDWHVIAGRDANASATFSDARSITKCLVNSRTWCPGNIRNSLFRSNCLCRCRQRRPQNRCWRCCRKPDRSSAPC